MSQLTPELYWHCLLQLKSQGKEKPVVANDLPFPKLSAEIVQPWRAGQTFAVSGLLASAREDVAQIRIVHTDCNSKFYSDDHYARMRAKGYSDFATDSRLLPFRQGTDHTNELLFGLGAHAQAITPAVEDLLIMLCRRFHLCADELRNRYSDRPGIEITDEYDVQDIMRALLRLHFNDVRPEEWTPSYGGGSARMDFLLKTEQTVVETKKTRKTLTDRGLGSELLVDIGRYAAHPDCKRLVCFVFDPERWIRNPRGLEADLSGKRDNLTVQVIIAPG